MHLKYLFVMYHAQKSGLNFMVLFYPTTGSTGGLLSTLGDIIATALFGKEQSFLSSLCLSKVKEVLLQWL